MQDRTCQMFKEVVFSVAGKRVAFHAAGALGGIADTLGAGKSIAQKAPTVEFITVTLSDILERAKAPRFIHFLSLDIEGAELEALKGFPFDKYQIGALDVEHNYEEPKRNQIEALMKRHGYRRVHTWVQDDFTCR
jgi:Methyltransferase FkbM domain